MQQLKLFESIPFNHGALMALLNGYKSPNDKISNLIAKGDILQLKKGLYINSEKHRNRNLSPEVIANSIYGPSYVSFDFALSYYGLIPEKVFSVQSLTTKRSRSFKTPIGIFEYIQSSASYYSIGIYQKVIEGEYSFLIASPEKALCDKLVFSKKTSINSLKNMRDFLMSDLRIESDSFDKMDLSIFEQCIKTGKKSKQIKLLINTVIKLKTKDVTI